jgi:adenylyltransferase/sulfurtransferase
MTPAELRFRIAAGRAPLILDVRSRWEYHRAHIPGAVPVPFWRAHSADIPAQPSDEVVVYCGHGPRARWAASALRRRGFTSVDLLDGHWSRWSDDPMTR